MTIKWIEDGADSAYEVWVGEGRRRLFLARKLGGRDGALVAAKAEELAMKAARPPAVRRALASVSRLFGRGVS